LAHGISSHHQPRGAVADTTFAGGNDAGLGSGFGRASFRTSAAAAAGDLAGFFPRFGCARFATYSSGI
jgi:hypothetical protein